MEDKLAQKEGSLKLENYTYTKKNPAGRKKGRTWWEKFIFSIGPIPSLKSKWKSTLGIFDSKNQSQMKCSVRNHELLILKSVVHGFEPERLSLITTSDKSSVGLNCH